MDQCFVIQPFDDGPYDARYRDVLEPAIVAAGLEPYRVDRDPKSSVMIESIENGISASVACVADISTDNPNVWYEVGFAMARRKPVILISATARITKYPFDIQHRHVIGYKTDTPSDFTALQDEITRRLRARIESGEQLEALREVSTTSQSDGLLPHELAVVVVLASTEQGEDALLSTWHVHREMERAGFTKAATNIAIALLKQKGLLVADTGYTEEAQEWSGVRLSNDGVAWLLSHQDHFLLRHEPQDKNDSDIPF